MTPTEQDKELREQVADTLRTGYHGIAETKVINHVMQLITAHLKAYTDEIRREVIGDGEVHVSHVCPPDNVGCAKFAAREQMRHEQRQALNTLATKWGVK